MNEKKYLVWLTAEQDGLRAVQLLMMSFWL